MTVVNSLNCSGCRNGDALVTAFMVRRVKFTYLLTYLLTYLQQCYPHLMAREWNTNTVYVSQQYGPFISTDH